MKIISKISICFAILSYILLMVCSIVTSTYAWQNTNEQVYDIVITGSQTYNLTPIKAIYMTMPRSDDFADGYYNRSVQHQNVYQLNGKSNFQGEGLKLKNTNTEVQNNYSDIRFGDSDVASRLWLKGEEAINNVGLFGLRTEDGLNQQLAVGSEKGQAFDTFTYDNHIFGEYQIENCSFVYQFNDFVISQELLELGNILTIETYYIDSNRWYGIRSNLHITYTLTTKNEHGEVKNTYVDEVWDKTNNLFNSWVKVNGVNYNGFYTTYDIGQHIYNNIIEEQREYVQISDLQIYIGSNWEDPGGPQANAPDQVYLNTTYYRPYLDGWDISTDPFGEQPVYFRSVDYRNVVDYNKGTMSIDTDGFTELGQAIGNTTDGIFNTEILPGITIWTVLLIPLSIGIIFAVLRYFAGG